MPAENIGSEIRQLTARGPSRGPQRGQVMPRRQAIAVALSMARQNKFGRKDAARAGRRSSR